MPENLVIIMAIDALKLGQYYGFWCPKIQSLLWFLIPLNVIFIMAIDALKFSQYYGCWCPKI